MMFSRIIQRRLMAVLNTSRDNARRGAQEIAQERRELQETMREIARLQRPEQSERRHA